LYPEIALFSPTTQQGCVAVGRVRTQAYAVRRQADSFAPMPKPRVYVETTIPSFYYDFRDSPAVVQRREVTRAWWADAWRRYELVTSSVVLDELARGNSNRVPARLGLLQPLPTLSFVPQLTGIVQTYLAHKLMPANPPEDALHLALASWHRCDFIVTWNCRHLANPRKAVHVRKINTRLGLYVPRLATPEELLEEHDERRMDGSG
jgi:predicted nucleic acid-binding protein